MDHKLFLNLQPAVDKLVTTTASCSKTCRFWNAYQCVLYLWVLVKLSIPENPVTRAGPWPDPTRPATNIRFRFVAPKSLTLCHLAAFLGLDDPSYSSSTTMRPRDLSYKSMVFPQNLECKLSHFFTAYLLGITLFIHLNVEILRVAYFSPYCTKRLMLKF